ncbi:hypothetical protein QEJ31_05260 [Pigmentibacter sp. JX0631]|uniref:hypothetical protein n=1 Tax=Pigmentibacter sp. JX0631 TaxID=2976982 RepID=UPI002468FEAE|nr:hypothetical protein [Pigmentibacter sp. JX0631]WGL61005.1 hypothetical protein QEJ31_05260 [Pigmentibacter sp. JX0631]
MKKILFLLPFLLASCESIDKRQSDNVSLKPWIGKNIAEVLKHPKYGTPDSKEKVGKNDIISYRQFFSADRTATNKDLRMNFLCKRSFVFDSHDIIIDVLEEGTCENTPANLPISSK